MGPVKRHELVFAATALLVAAACSEIFPRELTPGQPASAKEKPTGLDTRPVSSTCMAGPKPSTTSTLIGFEKVTPAKLTRPVEVVLHDGKLYVLEQGGRVLLLREDGGTSEVLTLDPSKIVAGGEAGLLGIAFHPKFADNGFVYLYYTAPNLPGAGPGSVFQSAIVRYRSNDGGLTLDPNSEKRILTVDQPYSNHNGGTIAFGKDGYLYFGLGDGGSGGDPQGNAQNKDTLLGKILRIDVDGGDPYAIPPTNPFANGGGRPEIYALGLRNPYRFRFDPVTGDLWAGDVGQSAREEIDRIVLGGNYGWNIREGKVCYPASTSCDATGLIDPVVDHPRSEASSITGGVVYRGSGVPLLTGKYVYGDFGQGTFFAIFIDDPAPAPMRLDEGLPRVSPSAFALDANGEIVLLDYGAGEVLRIVPGGQSVPEMPALLSETGCVRPGAPSTPADGLFFYDVNVAQWVDGATAERFLSVPADTVLRTSPEGQLALPPGSVAMKTLSAEGRRLETQLLLHRPDSTWSAYTYVWREDQTDAVLATAEVEVPLPSGRIHFVDPTGCIACHAGVLPTIGLEAAQLDRDDVDYGRGRLGNPLATLEKLGMLEAPVPAEAYTPLAREHGVATAERRARSYLHANCAFCHRGGEGKMDLRFGTPLGATMTCDVPSPVVGRARIAPRDPGESQIVRAMQATGDGRMPPVGTRVPDTVAIQTMSAWISSIAACE
jgi:glucose/arabinose dehydrogenase